MESVNFNDPQSCWDSESRKSPYSTVCDPDEEFCQECETLGHYCPECAAYLKKWQAS